MHSVHHVVAEGLQRTSKCCMIPYVRIGFLILLWYGFGTALSFFNKMLVGKKSVVFGSEPFPAPLFMSALQFAMQHLLARAVFGVGLIKRTAEGLSWQDWLKAVVPNGTCTGLDIGLSNMSLVLITISFYTMCKATVPLFLLFFAFIWGIEKPTWRLGLVVFTISCGLALLVSGETEFDTFGFSLVMVAACMSGLRFTLTQVFLHGHHGSAVMGGPLEILEALTPVMSVTVLLLSLVWERLWVCLPASVYFESAHRTGLTLGLIMVGACMAFLLVWTEYQVIKETSALTFMIAGTCKEIVTVLAAVVVNGDPFGWINAAGLAIVISGVVLFNVYKLQKIKKGEIVLKVVAGKSGRAHGDQLRTDSGEDAGLGDMEMEMEPLILKGAADESSGTEARRGGNMSPRMAPRLSSNGTKQGGSPSMKSDDEMERALLLPLSVQR